MAQTIATTQLGQIIGGIFKTRAQADQAIQAFAALPVTHENIQIVEHLSDKEIKHAYTQDLVDRGVAETQARYYDKEVRSGKILVVIHEVTNPGPIIHIFDAYYAEYNPDGSRNLRQDVIGMTAGVAIGAAVGGTVGGIVGGPLGAVAGVAAGVLLGGGSGAAVGTRVENKK
jgi:hypothetical protein